MKNINWEAVMVWTVLGGVFLIGGATGKTITEQNLSTCEQPQEVLSYRQPEYSIWVYRCADGEFRTYKAPLDNAGVDDEQ